MREGQTGSFSVAGGFDSSSSRISAISTVGENNLFGGGQPHLLRRDDRLFVPAITTASATPEPLVSSTCPLSAGVDLYSWEQFLPSFTRKSLGFAVRSSYPLSELGLKKLGPFSLRDVDAGLTYRFESVGITNLSAFTTSQILQFQGYSQTSEVVPTIRRFTVDNLIDPHSGSVQSLNLQLAGLKGNNT